MREVRRSIVRKRFANPTDSDAKGYVSTLNKKLREIKALTTDANYWAARIASHAKDTDNIELYKTADELMDVIDEVSKLNYAAISIAKEF